MFTIITIPAIVFFDRTSISFYTFFFNRRKSEWQWTMVIICISIEHGEGWHNYREVFMVLANVTCRSHSQNLVQNLIETHMIFLLPVLALRSPKIYTRCCLQILGYNPSNRFYHFISTDSSRFGCEIMKISNGRTEAKPLVTMESCPIKRNQLVQVEC